MRLQAMMVVAVGLLFVADTDKDKLQGTWKALTAERNGQVLKEQDTHRLSFDGDSFIIKRGDQVEVKGTFKVEPSKDPKTIDMMIDFGSEKGKTAFGIYALDGDDLKWCSAQPGSNDRPAEFSTKPNVSHMLVTFKREKP